MLPERYARHTESRKILVFTLPKVLLASWRGTRMEVTHVLHRVCENVLREPGVSEQELVNRARVCISISYVETILIKLHRHFFSVEPSSKRPKQTSRTQSVVNSKLWSRKLRLGRVKLGNYERRWPMRG